MPLALITAATETPVSLAEMKLYLRQEADFEDDTITRMIAAATRWIEGKTWRALCEQTLELHMDRFPSGRWIVLPRPKLISVTSVKYRSGGSLLTLDPSLYEVDALSEPGRLRVTTSWPSTDDELHAVQIRLEAGWSAEEFPEDLRTAVLMLVSGMYTHREGLPPEIREAVELLVSDYCVRSLAEIPYLIGTREALADLADSSLTGVSWPN